MASARLAADVVRGTAGLGPRVQLPEMIMRSEDIELVRHSHAQLRDIDAFGRRFYAHLFALQPQARRLFPADMGGQVHKLTDMVDSIVRGLDQPDELRREFTALGQRHAGYGVSEADYDDVGAALFLALRESLGAAFTPEVEQAWGTVYGDMAEIMIAAQNGLALAADE